MSEELQSHPDLSEAHTQAVVEFESCNPGKYTAHDLGENRQTFFGDLVTGAERILNVDSTEMDQLRSLLYILQSRGFRLGIEGSALVKNSYSDSPSDLDFDIYSPKFNHIFPAERLMQELAGVIDWWSKGEASVKIFYISPEGELIDIPGKGSSTPYVAVVECGNLKFSFALTQERVIKNGKSKVIVRPNVERGSLIGQSANPQVADAFSAYARLNILQENGVFAVEIDRAYSINASETFLQSVFFYNGHPYISVDRRQIVSNLPFLELYYLKKQVLGRLYFFYGSQRENIGLGDRDGRHVVLLESPGDQGVYKISKEIFDHPSMKGRLLDLDAFLIANAKLFALKKLGDNLDINYFQRLLEEMKGLFAGISEVSKVGDSVTNLITILNEVLPEGGALNFLEQVCNTMTGIIEEYGLEAERWNLTRFQTYKILKWGRGTTWEVDPKLGNERLMGYLRVASYVISTFGGAIAISGIIAESTNFLLSGLLLLNSGLIYPYLHTRMLRRYRVLRDPKVDSIHFGPWHPLRVSNEVAADYPLSVLGLIKPKYN